MRRVVLRLRRCWQAPAPRAMLSATSTARCQRGNRQSENIAIIIVASDLVDALRRCALLAGHNPTSIWRQQKRCRGGRKLIILMLERRCAEYSAASSKAWPSWR